MIKLTQNHIDAICHAELFLEGSTEKIESRKIIQRLEQDKLRLVELKLYIIDSMSQPKLPFAKDGVIVEESG